MFIFYSFDVSEDPSLYSIKKSHICEGDGTNLGISFWHLLMNLKDK